MARPEENFSVKSGSACSSAFSRIEKSALVMCDGLLYGSSLSSSDGLTSGAELFRVYECSHIPLVTHGGTGGIPFRFRHRCHLRGRKDNSIALGTKPRPARNCHCLGSLRDSRGFPARQLARRSVRK